MTLRKNEATIDQAVEVLGENFVVTGDQKRKLWRADVGSLPGIGYTLDELRDAAALNRRLGHQWRLVNILGYSLRKQRELIGTDRTKPPCFDREATWWMQSREDFWATTDAPPRYALLDLNGRWPKTSWPNQEKAIEGLNALGNTFVRAPEQYVSEAVLDFRRLHDERLLENWYHWGQTLDSDGHRVLVGYHFTRGLYVIAGAPKWGGCDGRRVCLLYKSTLEPETRSP